MSVDSKSQTAIDVKSAVQRRICVVGSAMVGKTAICTRFVSERFDERYEPTYENSFSKLHRRPLNSKSNNSASMGVSGGSGSLIDMHLKDTQGLSDDEIFRNEYGLGYHAYVLVYSIASQRSLDTLQTINMKLLNLTGTKVPRVLVGNKTDLTIGSSHPGAGAVVQRQVTAAAGRAVAEKWGCAFVECSAKKNQNIEAVFEAALNEIDAASGVPDPPSSSTVCGCFAPLSTYEEADMTRVETITKFATALSLLLGLVGVVASIVLGVQNDHSRDGLVVTFVLLGFSIFATLIGIIGTCAVRNMSTDLLRISSVATLLLIIAELTGFGVLYSQTAPFRSHVVGAAIGLTVAICCQSAAMIGLGVFQRLLASGIGAGLNSPYISTRNAGFYTLRD